MSRLFNMLSMFVIAFLPRSNHLLIHCTQVSFVEATIGSFILSSIGTVRWRGQQFPTMVRWHQGISQVVQRRIKVCLSSSEIRMNFNKHMKLKFGISLSYYFVWVVYDDFRKKYLILLFIVLSQIQGVFEFPLWKIYGKIQETVFSEWD